MTKTEPTAAQERAAIVAWLRYAAKNLKAAMHAFDMHGNQVIQAGIETYESAANVIERGDHNGEGK